MKLFLQNLSAQDECLSSMILRPPPLPKKDHDLCPLAPPPLPAIRIAFCLCEPRWAQKTISNSHDARVKKGLRAPFHYK